MTSQAWLDHSLVDRVVWTHQLVVVIPDTIRYNGTALMYITGGGNKNPGPPSATDEDLLCTALLAMANGVVGATLYQIPNAPIVFAEDPNVSGCCHCFYHCCCCCCNSSSRNSSSSSSVVLVVVGRLRKHGHPVG